MEGIELELLKSRRHKLLAMCQQYMAQSTDAQPSQSRVGRMAGRSVQHMGSHASKESRLFQAHALRTKEDQIREDQVNSLKKADGALAEFSKFWKSAAKINS